MLSGLGINFDYTFAGNSITVFQFNASTIAGDYNTNGVVDAADYTVWRDTLGQVVAPYAGADGNGDGLIDADDFRVWTSHFGETLLAAAGSGTVAPAITDPELAVGATVVSAPAESTATRSAANVDVARGLGTATLDVPFAMHVSVSHPRTWVFIPNLMESDGNDLLLLLATDRVGRSAQKGILPISERGGDDFLADNLDSQGPVNEPLALDLSGWR